jgi:2-polyprenyl-6-methoxyphenol hydroxylase-like FAD-dependent oxidoreductase
VATQRDHEVVVVGARVAGAATAMLLARRGVRVALVDRGRYGADTLSTHALMRGGVLLLSRWGLIDQLVAAGTPPVRLTRFDYGDEEVTVAIKPVPGVDALYAPRRSLLDRVLVDAAVAAGVDVRFGVTIADRLRDDTGRVAGVHGRDRDGEPVTIRARLVVGADGIRSTVARAAGAATVHIGGSAGAVSYGYWRGLPACGYEWFYRPRHSAGIIPTNDEQACVFAGTPANLLTSADRADLRGTYHRLLAAATDGAGGRLRAAEPPTRLHTWVGQRGFIRHAHGAGWVLVGDAASYLDPLSTHGITDALRDAELLAARLTPGATAGDIDALLDEFARTRDPVVRALLRVVDRIASYSWDGAAVRRHLLELSAAMGTELDLLQTVQPPSLLEIDASHPLTGRR